MITYTRYFNDTQTQTEWLNNNLTAEELFEYNTARQQNHLQWESYISQGLVTVESVYETVHIPEFNENIDVKIGEKLILASGVSPSQLQIHPSYANWLNVLPDTLFDKVILQY
jgi:hypothetical protein